jgi:quercetin dioxygenase-like cupin family protein
MKGILFTKAEADQKRVDQDWGSLTWFASKELTQSDNITVGRVVIKKGKSNPKHIHGNCSEVIHLEKGRLKHFVGKEFVLMEPGDTLVVPPGVDHCAFNIGEEDAVMIVAYPTGQRHFQTLPPDSVK